MTLRRRAEPLAWNATAALLVLAVAAAFYIPALRKTPGIWPVPLDDVYIHFAFARSTALGHPFEWIPGNGYSSGGTSLTYPILLAPAWLLGFRGARLGIFAAALACAAVFDACRSVRELIAPAPRWVAWTLAPLLLSVPLLDWSLFSGMETALFVALLGRALLAVRRVESAPAPSRARAQLRAGAWGALLVATRPEAVALALPLAVAGAHAARSLGALSSLARGAGPTALFLAAQALANRAFTSEWSAAGAVRKLLSSNPYVGSIEIAGEVIKNLIALRTTAFESALGRAPYAAIVPLLGLVAVVDRRSRRLAVSLFTGAVGAILLVSLNATARFQNLRYAAPSLAMLLIAAALGVAALARTRWPAARAVGAIAALAAIIAPARWFPVQITHFARSSANIAGQQVEVAARLAARSPRPRRVLVGDAGAIPYLSGLGAIDGLGLGGYRGMPFARASVHGVPAVVELIERLDDLERPDMLALYPSWWVGLADAFGRPIDAVRILDNVICAADEKVIYEADWSALAPAGETRNHAIDAIDVADLIDERAHAYEPSLPRGGWVIGDVLVDGASRRFDAGRIIPEGRSEAFTVARGVPRGGAALVMRTDSGGEIALRVEVTGEGRAPSAIDVVIPARTENNRWFEASVDLADVGGGDRVRIFARRNAWRNFHMWLMRP